MHILIINDDGPPSQVSSPYVHSFVHELQQNGHTVSVVLPHMQRSWIGKAHFAGKTMTPTYFRPGTIPTDDGTTHMRPRTDGGEEWILVDGTPASCAQLGIYHYFKERGPIDMVTSGPNYGRNSTALFGLSSGTIGGAMEAAVCGKRAVALSYAFLNRNHDPIVIRGASLMSVKVVEYLHKNWAEDVDLYTVNVPLIEGIEGPDTKVMYTNMLQNYWVNGSSFEEVDADDGLGPGEAEAQIREHGESTGEEVKKAYGHKRFKWAPRFSDVYKSVEDSEPGNDGWTVKEGHVSITPLKANFMHSGLDLIGKQVKLLGFNDTNFSNNISLIEQKTDAMNLNYINSSAKNELWWALVRYDDAYVKPKIIAAIEALLLAVNITDDPTKIPDVPELKVLDWSAYEDLDFDTILVKPESWLCCSYIIRKALIRKHHLLHTVRHHLAKHPTSILSKTFPETQDIELDYVEFLDEALAEAYELNDSLSANDSLTSEERQWWILKPGMSDRGQGIRLFSTLKELTEIFEEFDPDSDDEGGEEEEEVGKDSDGGDGVITSQLRHFVAQRYIHPPLLISGRKFHIRTYVLAAGALRVWVYKPMLALFSSQPYTPPTTTPSALPSHLTNTCLQNGNRDGSVRLFWDLVKDSGVDAEQVWTQIQQTVGAVFEAAGRGQRVHFQALENAFEIFGVDFVVGADGEVGLLEVNAYPDFRQTGEDLGGLIGGLMEGVVKTVGAPWYGLELEQGGECKDMVKVLDIELGNF